MRRFIPLALALAVTLPARAETPPAPRVLTLADAVRTALERQPQIRQARAASEAARARVDQARAPMLPQVTGTASYQRATANTAARSSTSAALAALGTRSSTATYDSFNFGITASQLVFDCMKTPWQWMAAKAGAEATVVGERTATQAVRLGVQAAFFAARAQKALVGVARQALDNQERHLQQIQGFVTVGTRPEIDLAQVRTDRANARVQLVNAENAYESAKAQLNQAMGVEGDTGYDVADEAIPPVAGEDGATDGLVDEAVRARPEFAALDAQERAQALSAKALKGAYGPSLGVSTSLSDGGEKLTNMAWNWNAMVTLSWPMFQGGATMAQSREAAANLQSLRTQADALRQQVRLDVEQARLGVKAAKAAIEAVQEAVVNARERFRFAEARYETGVGNAIELADAQLALTQAEAQKVQADFDLSAARARLLRALGREP